jgi:hypothetical protein
MKYHLLGITAASLIILTAGCGKNAPTSSRYESDGATVKMSEYNGPNDAPSEHEADFFRKTIEPSVRQARESYPKARDRFLDGLPKGYSFFVTSILSSSKGDEMGFFRVERIENGRVTGILSTKLQLVDSFTYGQRYTFSESELIDWTLTSPSGSEEGNFVGKFLETQNVRH